jgi:hypothetical protein
LGLDPGNPIVITDGYWMHIRHTRIFHRHYPEVRGEGDSLEAAADHLSSQLARGIGLADGRGAREAIAQALADVHAIRPGPPASRYGVELGSAIPPSQSSTDEIHHVSRIPR